MTLSGNHTNRKNPTEAMLKFYFQCQTLKTASETRSWATTDKLQIFHSQMYFMLRLRVTRLKF